MTNVDLSKLTNVEQIKKIDENTAVKYKVVEEKIDLEMLRKEIETLEAEIELINSQIISCNGNDENIKMAVDFYNQIQFPNKQVRLNRIAEIKNLLSQIK